MKFIRSIVLTLVALAATAFAGTYKLPKENPIASIAFPEGWKVELEDEGLDATSADDAISINIEFHAVEDLAGAIKDTLVHLAKSKVKIDQATQKKTEADVKGITVVNIDWDGEDEDGKCKISLTVLAVTPTKALLMLYWATPEGEKKHEKELGAIQESITPLAK